MTTPTLDYRKIVAGIAMHTRVHPALLRAVSLAHTTGGEVALVHATDRVAAGPSVSEAGPLAFEDVPARCAQLKASYPEITSSCIKVGPIWNALLETARGIDADLISISSHVHGRLSVLVGHTCDRVLHAADRDVLVTRTERYAEEQRPDNYQHILLAADLKEDHERAAQVAAALARQQGARLSLMHVMEHYPVDRENDDITPEDADPESYQRLRRDERLQRLATLIGTPEAGRMVTVTADAAGAAIPVYATTAEADLIVVGSHRPSGLGRLLGTTADEVVHRAPCDVLVVYLGE